MRFTPRPALHQRQLVQRPARPTARGWPASARATCRAAVPGTGRLRGAAGGRRRRSGDVRRFVHPILGIISQTTAALQLHVDGTVLPLGRPRARAITRSNEYEFYAQDSWQIGSNLTVTAGLRYSLFSPPWEVNGQQVAPDVNLGDWFDHARREHARRHPVDDAAADQLRPGGPGQRQPGLLRLGQEQLRAARRGGVDADAEGGFLGWLTGGDKMVVRGGYSIVYDRIGQAWPRSSTTSASFGLSTQLSSAVRRAQRGQPGHPLHRHQHHPGRRSPRAAGRLPADAAGRRGAHHVGLDSSIETPYATRFNVIVGRDLGTTTLRRRPTSAAGPQPPDPSRHGDAAEPDRPGLRRRLLHGGAAADRAPTRRRRRRRQHRRRSRTGRTCSPTRRFDGCRRATQNMAAEFMATSPTASPRSTTADQFCFPACSALGPVRVLQRSSTTRWRRRARSRDPSTTRCS